MKRSLYALLGLEDYAASDEVVEFLSDHPRLPPESPQATAGKVLADPAQKAVYDKLLHAITRADGVASFRDASQQALACSLAKELGYAVEHLDVDTLKFSFPEVGQISPPANQAPAGSPVPRRSKPEANGKQQPSGKSGSTTNSPKATRTIVPTRADIEPKIPFTVMLGEAKVELFMFRFQVKGAYENACMFILDDGTKIIFRNLPVGNGDNGVLFLMPMGEGWLPAACYNSTKNCVNAISDASDSLFGDWFEGGPGEVGLAAKFCIRDDPRRIQDEVVKKYYRWLAEVVARETTGNYQQIRHHFELLAHEHWTYPS